MAPAPSPEALASSTTLRRYARPASRPFGTPIDCCTAMNRPSSSPAPATLAASPTSPDPADVARHASGSLGVLHDAAQIREARVAPLRNPDRLLHRHEP